MSSDMEGKMQSRYDAPEPTLVEALASSLREIMQANGRPYRNDPASPGYQRDQGLFEEHMAQWNRANEVLAWFERVQHNSQT